MGGPWPFFERRMSDGSGAVTVVVSSSPASMGAPKAETSALRRRWPGALSAEAMAMVPIASRALTWCRSSAPNRALVARTISSVMGLVMLWTRGLAGLVKSWMTSGTDGATSSAHALTQGSSAGAGTTGSGRAWCRMVVSPSHTTVPAWLRAFRVRRARPSSETSST